MNCSTNAHPSSFILHPSSFRGGFTLVEMLTVVVIIGILASFVTAAAIAARKRARIFAIHQEVMQLDMAVRNVQTDYGDYPPDFSDWTGSDSLAVDRWLVRAFPRYVPTTQPTISAQMVNDIQNNYKVNVANPASALVVFLGGVPGVTGDYHNYSVQNPGNATPWRSDGFYADPTCPFGPNNASAGATLQPRIKAAFQFVGTRVDTLTGSPCFVPPGVSATPNSAIPAIPLPYVYFRAAMEQTNQTTAGSWCYNGSWCSSQVGQQFPPLQSNPTDKAVPYQKVVPSTNNAVINPPWRNNDSFQIISSGLDGLYGNRATPRTAGTPTGLSTGDFDNITNFIQNGSTLEDELKL